MTDTMTLEQVRDWLRAEAKTTNLVAVEARFNLFADAIDAAIKQREQDAKDATRYRWLRDCHDNMRPDWHVRRPNNDVPEIGSLDAAIDAAMAQESGDE